MDQYAPCPCGSNTSFADCCSHCHQGAAANSPEALMRSRYAAFVTGDVAYLEQTWHPDTRPQNLSLDDSPAWTSLTVLSSEETGDTGKVHFRALYREKDQWGYLEEHSDFVKEDGRWYYLSGAPEQGVFKPGRNDPCPCGSGKKFKACCIA